MLLYRHNISRNTVDHAVQCKQNRHLDHKLETSSSHGRAVFFINSLRLHVHLHHGVIVFLTLVLCLDRLQLRLHDSHQLGCLLLLDRQWEHQYFHN